MRGTILLPDLTIPNGAAVSNAWGASALSDAIGLTIQSPANVGADTYVWQVSYDGNTYVDLQDSSATAIKIPAASKAISYLVSQFGAGMYYRIKDNTGNTGADITFKCFKQFEY